MAELKKPVSIKQKTSWMKMQGAGNSFFITHFFNENMPVFKKNWPEISKTLCQSPPYADGVIVLKFMKKNHFEWLFYNADGSSAEMCGNGACCAVEYAVKNKLAAGPLLSLKTSSGKLKCEWKNNQARIFVNQSSDIQGPFEYCFKDEKISYMFINTSVPHAVIKNKSLLMDKEAVCKRKELAKSLRKKKVHNKKGMNVSFYCPMQQQDSVRGVSFERGVEDFTLACGTGALAIAQVYRRKYLRNSMQNIYVRMPGGVLKVEFYSNKEVSLMSPVSFLEEFEREI